MRPEVLASDHHAAAIDDRPRLRAFWCRVPSRPNFGDALTPWLIARITGRRPAFAPHGFAAPHYLVTGSVIAYATRQTVVWGAGILSRTDQICSDARLLAVRGPLTRSRAMACGARCPEIYGDPALLLPRLRPPSRRRRGIGFAPHFSDAARLVPGSEWSRRLKVIDLQQPIEEVVDAITSCEVVLASSLHAIVASHAYGIPAAWIKFRNLPSGDDAKFEDYYGSVGLRAAPVSPPCAESDVDCAAARAVAPKHVDIEPLWRVCPFRK